MHVWVSEFTYKRLVDGLGEEIPILHTDERGFNRIDLPAEVVRNATENFGADLDHALNEHINHNQRTGDWPKKSA